MGQALEPDIVLVESGYTSEADSLEPGSVNLTHSENYIDKGRHLVEQDVRISRSMKAFPLPGQAAHRKPHYRKLTCTNGIHKGDLAVLRSLFQPGWLEAISDPKGKESPLQETFAIKFALAKLSPP